MQVRACAVVRGRLAIGHYTHVSLQGAPTMGSARQTGGDGGIQCVSAPVLVRGEVQVDRHSIAFLVVVVPSSITVLDTARNHSKCPNLICTSPLGAFQAPRLAAGAEMTYGIGAYNTACLYVRRAWSIACC